MEQRRPDIYDEIGHGYARMRLPDARIAGQIGRALGDAKSVCNVGAGTGSYEPEDRRVVALEPSRRMLSQRQNPAGERTPPGHLSRGRGLPP